MKTRVSLTVNGESHDVLVPVHKTLLEVLREDLGLTGTKHGCELGECGTCTVLVDGEPVLSCLALPVEMPGRGRSRRSRAWRAGSELHPLQQAFAELGAAQCGYCTPGILLTAEALLADEPEPTRDEVREALAGNLCRCTGYTKILDAVELAALRMKAGGRPRMNKEALHRHRPAAAQDRRLGQGRRRDAVRRRPGPAPHGLRQAAAQPATPTPSSRRIDTTRARALPGVYAVITGHDLPRVKFGILPVSQDEEALCVEKVRMVGDAVAAVAAVDEETAERGVPS